PPFLGARAGRRHYAPEVPDAFAYSLRYDIGPRAGQEVAFTHSRCGAALVVAGSQSLDFTGVIVALDADDCPPPVSAIAKRLRDAIAEPATLIVPMLGDRLATSQLR